MREDFTNKLDLLGISGIANLAGCIKMAKYYEMEKNDVIFTVATDSMDLYESWVEQLGKDVAELDAQWNNDEYWREKYLSYKNWDKLIREFNAKTGLQ